MPTSDTTAEMIRFDLANARAAWLAEAATPDELGERQRSTFLCQTDEAGFVFDFHALRHTFITNPVRSGVHPNIAQQLARHSTITLTMDHYSHVDRDEQHCGLSKLPDLCHYSSEALRMTDTYGNERRDSVLAESGTDSRSAVHSDAVSEPAASEAANAIVSRENTAPLAILGEIVELRPAGIEPATCGLEVQADPLSGLHSSFDIPYFPGILKGHRIGVPRFRPSLRDTLRDTLLNAAATELRVTRPKSRHIPLRHRLRHAASALAARA